MDSIPTWAMLNQPCPTRPSHNVTRLTSTKRNYTTYYINMEDRRKSKYTGS